MLKSTGATGALLFTLLASSALAGGIDRSGQSVSVLFEEGRYAEFSLGFVSPDITAEGPDLGTISDVGESYFQLGAAYKADLNDKWSYAIIFDQPFGADIAYSDSPLDGTRAELTSYALTGLAQYNINQNFSAYGGLKVQQVKAEADVPLAGSYTVRSNSDYGVGYVLGAAYEKPEIALRVALTYSSQVEQNFDTREVGGFAGAGADSVTEVDFPETVNLEFQTGVAANTLVFGSVRWAAWDGVEICPPNYPPGCLVSYDDDVLTYSLGVGRRFNEKWSGAITLGYEKSEGDNAPNLGPTDGFKSIGIGATYTMDSGTEVTGGLRYIDVGDATSDGAGGANGNFEGNDAIAAGIRIGFHF